jgi:hypothetical protein
MVMLYVAGKPIGTWAEAEKLLPEFAARNQSVEFRDDAGKSLGTFTPTPGCNPSEPLIPWEPDITREEIDRRIAEPGLTIDEVRERLGWK